jgi:ferredoxin
LQQAEHFARSIQQKIDMGDFTCPEIPKSILPGFITEFPDSGTRLLVRQPRIIVAACNACGACVRKCPVGAIQPDTLKINEYKCLRCYACVKVCPKAARTAGLRLPVFRSIFYHIGMKRKEIETFL